MSLPGAIASADNPLNKTNDASDMTAPQVLVLVWAGTGWTDLISINYDKPVSDKVVKDDIDAISKGTGWVVNNLRITTKKIPVPGASASTSATFYSSTGLASGDAAINVDPIILALKRLDRLQLSFLVGKNTRIYAPAGYTDDKISVVGVYSPGNIQYTVKIIDHTLTNLDWPTQQASSSPPTTNRNNHWNVFVVLLLAGAGAIVAYFITRKMTKGK